MSTTMKTLASVLLAATLVLPACADSDPVGESATSNTAEADGEAPSTSATNGTAAAMADVPSGEASTFQIEVWADNWMAVYVNGELVGEDSVSITTERSFNAETFTFKAAYPFTVAIEAKDFKETDSGLEYIGEQNQQMGDGGIIAQITDSTTGEVVVGTDSSWKVLVVHRAPLNTDCESNADPDATCDYEIVETPSDWAASEFDDGAWSSATEWTAADVGPKDGYDEISWDVMAELIWGSDREGDNSILLRANVTN